MATSWFRNFFLLAVAVLASCAHSDERINEANFYTKLGISSLVSQECTEALRYLLEAEKREPDNAELQNALGLAYYCKGEYQLAVKAYARAAQLKPDFSEALNNLGAAYATLGQYDKAIEAFDQALASLLYGTPERAWLNKGDVYAARLDSRNALQSYEKAVALAMPKAHARQVVCEARSRIGRVHISEKRYVEAVRTLQSAAKLCPKDPQSYYQLSLAYSRLGKKDEAIGACERVQALAAGSTDAQACGNYIQLLKGKGR